MEKRTEKWPIIKPNLFFSSVELEVDEFMKTQRENTVYERVRARVKFFSRERGYGFIKRDNKPDIFFSSNELAKSGITYVQEEDILLFDLVPVPGKGGKAINIKRVNE